MNKQEFQNWCKDVVGCWPLQATMGRVLEKKLRAHDPKLADLMIELDTASVRVIDYIKGRIGTGS